MTHVMNKNGLQFQFLNARDCVLVSELDNLGTKVSVNTIYIVKLENRMKSKVARISG
jgi:hypothetical protein